MSLIDTDFQKSGCNTIRVRIMSGESKIEELYRRKEEARKVRARKSIAEKLAIAEELRDLQKALAPLREANRTKVRRAQRRD